MAFRDSSVFAAGIERFHRGRIEFVLQSPVWIDVARHLHKRGKSMGRERAGGGGQALPMPRISPAGVMAAAIRLAPLALRTERRERPARPLLVVMIFLLGSLDGLAPSLS